MSLTLNQKLEAIKLSDRRAGFWETPRSGRGLRTLKGVGVGGASGPG